MYDLIDSKWNRNLAKVNNYIIDNNFVNILFEARVNESIGNSVLPFCKQLFSLNPEYAITYKMMRNELHNGDINLDYNIDEEHTDLLEAFNNRNISHDDFQKMVEKCEDKKELKNLRRILSKF